MSSIFNDLIEWLNRSFNLKLPLLPEIQRWPVLKALWLKKLKDPIPSRADLPLKVRVEGTWKIIEGQGDARGVELTDLVVLAWKSDEARKGGTREGPAYGPPKPGNRGPKP